MISFAVCTYNRATRLESLINAMRAQRCSAPYEILIVNNNSTDDTLEVLSRLAGGAGAPLRYVTEVVQGIVPARNRAISESLSSDILVFIDDDELPSPDLLDAARHAIEIEGARCVGGRIDLHYSGEKHPNWLDDELQGFLGAVDYGRDPFWITDDSHPLWTGNVAFDVSLFRDEPSLRFDSRYNRAGHGVGGGEDAAMFRILLDRRIRMRYRPDMAVTHLIDKKKLKRKYFLYLHYRAGLRFGAHELGDIGRGVFGVPPFMIRQLLEQAVKWGSMMLRRHPQTVRQGMNVCHALGTVIGYLRRPR